MHCISCFRCISETNWILERLRQSYNRRLRDKIPNNSTLLKYPLIKTSVLDPTPPSDYNIHFIPHGWIQSIDAITVKMKSSNRIISWHKSGSSLSWIFLNQPWTPVQKNHPLAILYIIDIAPTYITETSGKRLIVVKKDKLIQLSNIQYPASHWQRNLDVLIEKKINTSLVTYTDALQK